MRLLPDKLKYGSALLTAFLLLSPSLFSGCDKDGKVDPNLTDLADHITGYYELIMYGSILDTGEELLDKPIIYIEKIESRKVRIEYVSSYMTNYLNAYMPGFMEASTDVDISGYPERITLEFDNDVTGEDELYPHMALMGYVNFGQVIELAAGYRSDDLNVNLSAYGQKISSPWENLAGVYWLSGYVWMDFSYLGLDSAQDYFNNYRVELKTSGENTVDMVLSGISVDFGQGSVLTGRFTIPGPIVLEGLKVTLTDGDNYMIHQDVEINMVDYNFVAINYDLPPVFDKIETITARVKRTTIERETLRMDLNLELYLEGIWKFAEVTGSTAGVTD